MWASFDKFNVLVDRTTRRRLLAFVQTKTDSMETVKVIFYEYAFFTNVHLHYNLRGIQLFYSRQKFDTRNMTWPDVMSWNVDVWIYIFMNF